MRINSLYPGSIPTPIHAGFRAAASSAITASISAGRTGTPEDIALASLYLASDDAKYITRAELSIDGGLNQY